MLKQSMTTTIGVTALALGMTLPAHAGSNGKADLDSVIPQGPADPNSGAPLAWKKPIHDQQIHKFFLIDRLEYGDVEGTNNYLWDAQGWIGGDYNKLWLKTEGEGPMRGGSPEDTEFQALYSRTISPFWSAQAGLRYDINPNPDRGFAVLGLQGLAPYWFEVDLTAYIGNQGRSALSLEAEYDLLLSQRLILQPRTEINAYGKRDAANGIGDGLSDIALGMRLRYEFSRQFAPYVGVEWSRKFGDTADFARAADEAVRDTVYVMGVRFWF